MGGSDRMVVKPMRDLITDYDTYEGFLGPSWARHTYFREGCPFQPLYPVCVHFGRLIIVGGLFDY
jgi:hypothetical protein